LLTGMRLFLDTCSLNRLWDDQKQVRVHLEAESVIYILDSAKRGKEELVSSDYLLAEILDNPDPVRRADVMTLLRPAVLNISEHPDIEQRASELKEWNITDFDALHVAAAEAASCDYLLTTDDKFFRRAARAGGAIHVKVLNPFDYPRSSPPS